MVLVDKELRGWSIPQLHMDNYLEFDEVQLGVAPGKGTQPVPKGVLKKKFAIHQAEFNADLWISTNFDFAF